MTLKFLLASVFLFERRNQREESVIAFSGPQRGEHGEGIPGSWVLGPGSWVLGPGSWVLGPGSWVLGPGSWVLGPGSWVLGPGLDFTRSEILAKFTKYCEKKSIGLPLHDCPLRKFYKNLLPVPSNSEKFLRNSLKNSGEN
ncbi:Protein CBG20042 [Caenorhabditis briggsae]|uniref:Protein CBG20042 n=1 Tax=Caenorhabditis briggsae TaxID=6238 RepID=A8XWZ7_CAEBR|nr:Protein CBG20042 [Caenorhabditis briggsae]CAP37166.1 Protein CBG20042 [Caenorhabditis briggsae]